MNDWNAGLMRHLGMRFVEITSERVVAELDIGEHLTTVGGAGKLLSLTVQTQMLLDR